MTAMKLNDSLLLVAALLLFQCTTKKDTDSTEDGWKGMDEFHMVMAESFHPFRDSADLAPARALAGEMVALAKAWSENERPGKVKGDRVEEIMDSLVAETQLFSGLISNGDTVVIGQSLTRMHDHFHHLQEAWYSRERNHH